MWWKLLRLWAVLAALLVCAAGVALGYYGGQAPDFWMRAVLLVLAAYILAAGWIFARAALTIGGPSPGHQQPLPTRWNPAPRVMLPCDVCIRQEAIALCRGHALYVCLTCANIHDKAGCTYEPLPIGGLVCQ